MKVRKYTARYCKFVVIAQLLKAVYADREMVRLLTICVAIDDCLLWDFSDSTISGKLRKLVIFFCDLIIRGEIKGNYFVQSSVYIKIQVVLLKRYWQ